MQESCGPDNMHIQIYTDIYTEKGLGAMKFETPMVGNRSTEQTNTKLNRKPFISA